SMTHPTLLGQSPSNLLPGVVGHADRILPACRQAGPNRDREGANSATQQGRFLTGAVRITQGRFLTLDTHSVKG
ncbi:MAG: hypothetical protein V2A79_08430, partial [Planctomycetota bacterium]